jgi:predicted Zn-dependent protease with MMP-like domain
MEKTQIIMTFSTPPSLDDLQIIANDILINLPTELSSHCKDLAILVEDFADDLMLDEYETDDAYELLCAYRSGKEIAPGIESRNSSKGDTLILYRRAILDFWCETCDDLNAIMRHIIIEEIGLNFDFTEDDIFNFAQRD